MGSTQSKKINKTARHNSDEGVEKPHQWNDETSRGAVRATISTFCNSSEGTEYFDRVKIGNTLWGLSNTWTYECFTFNLICESLTQCEKWGCLAETELRVLSNSDGKLFEKQATSCFTSETNHVCLGQFELGNEENSVSIELNITILSFSVAASPDSLFIRSDFQLITGIVTLYVQMSTNMGRSHYDLVFSKDVQIIDHIWRFEKDNEVKLLCKSINPNKDWSCTAKVELFLLGEPTTKEVLIRTLKPSDNCFIVNSALDRLTRRKGTSSHNLEGFVEAKITVFRRIVS